MKIEKLNENKIRIMFNHTDLKENNVDVHSFMSNSIESQRFFLSILDLAEQEVGFITDDYKLCIDALALNNGNFIVTVTRIEKEILKSTRVQPRRKENPINDIVIYKFSNLDDFLSFENCLSIGFPNFADYFSKFSYLYEYQNLFFLIFENCKNNDFSKIFCIVSEFASSLQSSQFAVDKIKEYGNLVSPNAIHKK